MKMSFFFVLRFTIHVLPKFEQNIWFLVYLLTFLSQILIQLLVYFLILQSQISIQVLLYCLIFPTQISILVIAYCLTLQRQISIQISVLYLILQSQKSMVNLNSFPVMFLDFLQPPVFYVLCSIIVSVDDYFNVSSLDSQSEEES